MAFTMSLTEARRARGLLCALQTHLGETLRAARRAGGGRDFARVAAVTTADTIYHVDRISEHAIEAWLGEHWPRKWPVEVVMEGLEDRAEPLTFPAGTPVARTAWRLILDPIDGTRNLMYDKRSAWILAGLAPQRGRRTHVGDIVVAAMTELPTTKAWAADQLSAVRGAGLVAERHDVRGGGSERLRLRPSTATDCAGGFAGIVKFFPEGKALTAALEEALWRELLGPAGLGSPQVFDDQYISTGGQLYELIAGHDRFVADLRPLVFAKLGLPLALVCHPYDICTALLATEAGAVIEGPDGRALRAPLDTVAPVAWVGYANPALARRMRPVLRRVLTERLGAPDGGGR